MTDSRRGRLRRWAEALLHIDDTPRRTAAALAIGVFVGFSPLVGLHNVLGLSIAFALNLNRLAVLLGVNANLPWIAAGYYTFVTVAGAALIGTGLPPGFRGRVRDLLDLSFWTPQFWQALRGLLQPFFWPFVVGSTVGALILAVLTYRLALAVIALRRGMK